MKCKRITYAEVIEALTVVNRKLSNKLDEIEASLKPLQTKIVNATIAEQTVIADDGKTLARVIINGIDNKPTVYPAEETQALTFENPASGVIVIGTGEPTGKTELDLTVTPMISAAEYIPDEGTVYKKVTVSAVDKIESIEGSLEGGTFIFAEPVKGVEISEIMNIDEMFLEKAYPVGSIYMSTINESPATFLGGTWSPLVDKFLIGASNNFPAQSTGGAVSSTKSISGTIGGTALTVDQMPAHTHDDIYYSGGKLAYGSSGAAAGDYIAHIVPSSAATSYPKYDISTGSAGSGNTHTHTLDIDNIVVPTMPPYLSVYMWQRIA